MTDAHLYRPRRVFIGLGVSPGIDTGIRHNLGKLVLRQLGISWQLPFREAANWCCNVAISDQDFMPKVILVEPTTPMNESGQAAKLICSHFQTQPRDVVVIHDDISLPFGTSRIAADASATSHRGVLSVKDALQGASFARVRVGIGKPASGRVLDFVLSPLEANEADRWPGVLQSVVELIDNSVLQPHVLF